MRAVNAYKFLIEEKREYVLSKQFLRCATSVGANVEEAQGGQSLSDFVAKLSIAYKEARETKYWIRLLNAGSFLEDSQAASLILDVDELVKIIGSILITSKQNLAVAKKLSKQPPDS